ncbi:MAG: potassium channel protein [Legionella sp.]|nr:potassium channel protein [Legionella sp.]
MKLSNQRPKALFLWEKWFEFPLIILALLWLILLVLELVRGLNPALETLSFTIWIIFIIDFIVRLYLTPSKMIYLKSNWFALIVLIFPAIRIFRLFSFLRVTRSVYLFKIVTSLRHSMRFLGFTLGKHGFYYVVSLTFIIILVGAAGIYTFEGTFTTYADALWWAAMMITTMGSDFWPKTIEGRILCLALAIYAFAIFGYITAVVASFLIEKDKQDSDFEANIIKAIEQLTKEIQLLNQRQDK